MFCFEWRALYKKAMSTAAVALIIICICACVLLATRPAPRLPTLVAFRDIAGLFSNVIECIMVELCFPRHRVECTGWPSDVLESMPNVPVSRGEHTDVERFGIGHRCYIARDSLLYESPRFAGIRQRMHHYFKPGGLFCPAPAILAKARSWWESNMRGATFVVGVHGRAAMHYGSSDLESHIRDATGGASAARHVQLHHRRLGACAVR